MALTGWTMDEDRIMSIEARQAIPIGHKAAHGNSSSAAAGTQAHREFLPMHLGECA